ncbi:hypothetical protein [Sediminicoccus rosea]|uniref:Uncharacterized protein n=1 Tax=Sediminicoccus rosea TaxID=1225128 RepID=A0ABZ0PCH7_9PROT|nr:hypothetical protein [Sediminicoccus rosea]WPB83093.1 hypothetical protein R9Z33_13360 [Sediminicoccus rosea]
MSATNQQEDTMEPATLNEPRSLLDVPPAMPRPAAKILTEAAPVVSLAQQIGGRIDALAAKEAAKIAEWQEANLDGADHETLARLDADRKAIRAEIEGLEGARDALHRREAAETARAERAALEAKGAEAAAAFDAFAAEGATELGGVVSAVQALTGVLSRLEALPLAGQLPMETRINLRDRITATLGFAFRGLLAIPSPTVMPDCPFTRFAADARADLARVGLPMPAPTIAAGEGKQPCA